MSNRSAVRRPLVSAMTALVCAIAAFGAARPVQASTHFGPSGRAARTCPNNECSGSHACVYAATKFCSFSSPWAACTNNSCTGGPADE
jgi:hypothetical protein